MLVKFKIITVVIFVFIASGCSTPEMFTLTPDREKVETADGTEIAFLEDDLIFSNIEFEEESDGNYIFYVFVYNKSGKKLKIEPSEIKMIAFDKNKKPLEGFNTFWGIDPQLMVGKLNSDINSRKTEHDVSTGLNFIFALVNTVVDLADNNNNDAAEVLENVAVFTENQVHEEIDYSNDVEYLKSQKKLWEHDVLPQIELDAQEDMGGLVFIPACPQASFIKIIIPFEEVKHAYFFKREKITSD